MKYKGTVRWYDSVSGEGVVRRKTDGACLFFHFTSLRGCDKHNYSYPTKHDQVKFSCIAGLSCEFDAIEDTTFRQISDLRLVEDPDAE